jgi:hypothetical protein
MRSIRKSPMLSVAALVAIASFAPLKMASAEPTEITVRVLSKNAKFVGTGIGGMRITMRDAHTGEILTSGLLAGGTGDTKRVMHSGDGRRAQLSDESVAKFVAVLDLTEPRMVEVEAFGPLGQPQAAHRVVSTQWVVPGRHLSGGDGWVLELPGFVVDVLAPPAGIKLGKSVSKVDLRANVVMMCGCPIKPESMWDANSYEVKAIVKRNGEAAGSYDLSYAGEPSQFSGSVAVSGPGAYEVIVYAYDAANGNTGLDRTTFIVK